MSSEFSVTHTQRFLTPDDTIDDPQSYEEVAFLVREATIAPGATVEIALPSTYGHLSNVCLAYDLELTYPAQLPGLAYLATNNFQYPKMDITYQSLLLGGITAANTNPLVPLAVDLSIYSVGNYALDPPENIGYCGMFQNITLQSETGTVIDQSVSGNDFESLMLLKQATATTPELWQIDQAFGTNVFQWTPRLDPLLVPQSNVTGTRRATGLKFSQTGNSWFLTATKSVSHPVPLNFGTNFYLPEMGNCKLLVTFNQLSRMGFTAAPRYYSGYMHTETHCANSVLTAQQGGDTKGMGYNLDYPIGSYSLSYNGTIGNADAPINIPSIVSLTITLTSLVLDTRDLSAILGDPILTLPHPMLKLPIVNSATPINTYPTCGMLQNGITIFMRIANADRNEVVRGGTNGPLSPPVLRDNWIKRFVPAGLIGSIYLGSVGGFSAKDVTGVLGAPAPTVSTVSGGTSGATLEFIDSQVFVKFATPLTFTLPIFNMGVDASDAFPSEFNTYALIQRFGIEYLVCENLPTGLQDSSRIPNTVSYQAQVTNASWNGNVPTVLQASPNLLASIPGSVDVPTQNAFPGIDTNPLMFNNLQCGPELIQPSSIKISNLRITAKRELLSSETLNFLQETSKSIEGLRITRPVAQTVSYNLQTFDNVELSFQSLPQQVYGFVFGVRNVSAAFIDPRFSAYKPFTSLASAQLMQGSYQTLNITAGDMAGVMGHHLPQVIPSFPSLNAGLVSAMCKGAGQNPYFMDKWSMLFGNMYGSTESDGTLKLANLAYIQRFGYCKDLVYGLNTLGGAASLDIRTNFLLRFSTVSSVEVKQTVSGAYFQSCLMNVGAPPGLIKQPLSADPQTNLRLNSSTWFPGLQGSVIPCLGTVSTTVGDNVVESFAVNGYCSGSDVAPISLLASDNANPAVQLYITSFYRKQWVIRHEQGADPSSSVVVWSILS